MDKFDESIKNARETHESSEHFVEETMQAVMNQQPDQKKTHGIRFWLPIAAGAVVVIALVFIFLPTAKSSAPGNANKTNVASTGSSAPASSAAPTAVPAGTSNADLASDLSNVQGAMNQESNDQSSANSALNDQQQEITVPTD
jgi:hypothetical protein